MDRLLQRGHILKWGLGLSILLSTVWISQGTFFCHECLDGEPSQFCNTSSNQRQCNEGTEVCVTTVTNERGRLFTKKGCMLEGVCNVAEQSSPDLCSTGIVTGRCTYCCKGDACNYDKFDYSPTTPAPTTTTVATTTDMVDFITTVAPPTCDSQNLTKCVSAYGDIILVLLNNPSQNFPYFCRHVPSMFQCVANAMASCCPDNQLIVQEKLNLVAERMWALCPRDCDMNQGQVCTSAVVTKVIEGIVSGNETCTTLRRDFHLFQTCIVINIGTCGQITRVGFENKVKVIQGALQVSCSDAGVNTTEAPPSDITTTASNTTTDAPSDCDEESATACLVSLAQNLTGSDPPEKDVICQVLIPEVKDCLEEHVMSCPADVKERVERALNFTLELAGDVTDDCVPTTEAPPACDTTAARACALEIYEVIDVKGDYGQACRMVDDTIACVLANVTDCTEREKVSLNRTLDVILKTLEGKCDKFIKMVTECKDLELEEGRGEKTVTFVSNYDPKVLCGGETDCKIYVDIAFEKATSPKCRDGTAIEQIVCRPETTPPTGWPCSVEIRSDNWQDPHNLHISAAIDGKTDGDQVRELTLIYKKVVQGQVKELMSMDTCQITVIDHDTNGQCESLNDPHIKTFDGVLYDNFYEGPFVLYKHQNLPCEVHALYQRCRVDNFYGTCNCGVAIKSGDYVFFAESCRRKKQYCRHRHRCYNLLRAKSYVWDEVTDGTRIFRRPTGFEVQLPHGTRIKIQYYKHVNLINIWIVPSAADFMNTTGLCGFYNGKKEDDLLLPDGSVYSGTDVGQFKQPRDFCKAWRVTNRKDQIYRGVPRNPWTPPKYCVCQGPDCSQIECGARHLVSTCDNDNSGEITFDQMPRVKPEDVESRSKRAVDSPDVFEFDIEYEPPEDATNVDRTWSVSAATTFCKDYFDKSEIARLCHFQVQTGIDHHINICVQDIMLADDTTFAVSALEGLKETCTNDVNTETKFAATDIGRRTADEVGNKNCEQDCSNNGNCVKGRCECHSDYVGDICDVKSDAVPRYVSGEDDGLCDDRRGDCSSIIVFADRIIKSDTLTCHLNSADITEIGIQNTSHHFSVKANWISSSQVTCRVPRDRRRGIYVMLSNDGHHQSMDAFLHISRDPICHDCRVSENNAFCERKPNNCIIENRCYANGETPLNDACSVCDPSHSESDFKRIRNVACIGATMLIVILLIVILAVIVISAFIMFCCCKRKRKAPTPEEGVRHELIRKFRTDSPIRH